jgi:hypothetical protein
MRGQHITRVNECEQRFQFVIAIIPAAADMQRQIDLGVGDLANQTVPTYPNPLILSLSKDSRGI